MAVQVTNSRKESRHRAMVPIIFGKFSIPLLQKKGCPKVIPPLSFSGFHLGMCPIYRFRNRADGNGMKRIVRKARYLSRTTNDIQKRTPVQFSSLDDFRRRGLGEDRPSSPTGRCVRFWRRMRRRSGRGFLLTRVIGGASSCRSLSPPCVAAGYVTARSTAGLNKLVNGSSAEADLQVFQVAFRSIRLVCKNTIPARQRSFRRRHCEAQHGGSPNCDYVRHINRW
jgi:hypothetical protein